MAREEPADAAQLRTRGEDLVRKGRAMIRAAENMGASVETRSSVSDAASVDFGTLPGHSPEARAEALFVGRRIRDRMFPNDIFGEPAWDVLLALFLAERSGKDIAIESIFPELGVNNDTGQRYLGLLESVGLVTIDATLQPIRAILSQSGLRLVHRFFEMTEGSAPSAREAFTSLRLIARSDQ